MQELQAKLDNEAEYRADITNSAKSYTDKINLLEKEVKRLKQIIIINSCFTLFLMPCYIIKCG